MTDVARTTKPPDPPAQRCGYVAIVGPPNVGKSTLMNALVGERLSIVTPKPHTTRTLVLAIVTDPNRNVQVIFLDTPGMVEMPRYRLHEAMAAHIERSLRDADIVLALFDCARPDPAFIKRTIELTERAGKPSVCALNKIDLAEAQPDLSPYPDGTIPISALHQVNLRPLGDAIAEKLPHGPFLYPPDTLATQPERFFVAELIRESVFELTRKEVPYTSAVAVEQFIERKPKDYVQATILVDRDSQKGIMIGHRGARLKRIGETSRRKIEEFLGRPVYLELHVKAKPDWMKRDSDLTELGYLGR